MIRAIFRFFAFTFATVAWVAAAGQSLQPGDVAPPIRLSKWVRGPRISLKRGHRYVVDFWSPTSPQCAQTIPMLTALAKGYGDKTTFLGIAIDSGSPLPVLRFVAQHKDSIGYSLAVDRDGGVTKKGWMVAAGMGAPRFIPTAFVVGPDRRIQWIGSSFDLPGVLAKVLDPSWDVKKFLRVFRVQQDRMNKQYALRHDPVLKQLAEAQAMIRAARYRNAIGKLDAALASDSPRAHSAAKFAVPLALYAYRQLEDMRGYYTESRRASAIWSSDPHILNVLAWDILDPNSRLKVKDYPLALKYAQRAVNLSRHRNPNLLDTLAWAYWRTGNRRDAISTESAALALANDKDRSEMSATLRKFTESQVFGQIP